MIEIRISLILQNLVGWMLFNLHGNLVHTPRLGAQNNASIDLRYSVNPLKYRCHGFLRGPGVKSSGSMGSRSEVHGI